jgi:hypothetical protein
MSVIIPDGYAFQDHLVWGDLGKGGILSKGYSIDFPDLSSSDDQEFIDLECSIRLICGSLQADERIQLQVYTSNEFNRPLDRFAADTEKSKIEICTQVRSELVQRFRERMKHETLIQSNARLYLSSKLPAFIKEDRKKVRGFDSTFQVISRSFAQRQLFFDMLLRGQGGSVEPLDDMGHYRELLGFWSPGQARIWNPKAEDIDWLRTVSDLCRFSDLAPRQAPECGFHLDGFIVAALVYKTMPRSTWMKTMSVFQSLTIPGLRITLNMQPLPVESELRYEEERFSKLVSNLSDPSSPSLQSECGLDRHRDRMRRLLSNQVLPFRCQIVILISDRTRDGVDSKIEAVRAAIGKSCAESFQPIVSTSALAFYNASTPSYGAWLPYKDYWHKIDDLNLSNMWPARSTPEADLRTADWISDNDQNGLMGGKLFVGAQPVHMLLKGNTGSGKSSLLQTIVLQSAIGFRFLTVIDDGLSWMTTCNKLDPSCRPIIVRSNGGQTFNPFDTRGLPRSSQHLASATALCHLLVGQHADSDKDKLRAAILAEAISTVYGVAYRRWRKDLPEEHYEICLQTAQILRFQQKRGIETFLDAFLEAQRSAGGIDPDDDIHPDDALALDRDPATEHLVQNLAFASWSPQDVPNALGFAGRVAYTSPAKRPASRAVCDAGEPASTLAPRRPVRSDSRRGVERESGI